LGGMKDQGGRANGAKLLIWSEGLSWRGGERRGCERKEWRDDAMPDRYIPCMYKGQGALTLEVRKMQIASNATTRR